MNSVWRWKSGAALVSVLLAVWFVLPNFLELPDVSPEEETEIELPWYAHVLPNSRVRLGLDLQGGIHMVLGIDLNRAILNEADRYARDIEDYLKDEEIEMISVERKFDAPEMTVLLKNPKDSSKFENFIRTRFKVLLIKGQDAGKGEYLLEVDPSRRSEVERQTIGQALETLRNRLDEFGVAEPSIQAQGKDRIVVQLPGLEDPKRAKDVLGRTAQLEFRIVDDQQMSDIELASIVSAAKKRLPKKSTITDINRHLQGKLPPGTMLRMKEEKDTSTGEVIETPLLLESGTMLSGEMLEDARIGYGEYNQAVVNVRFNAAGARELDELTGKYMNRRLAIVLDDRVQSDPVIRARIADGRAQITFGSLQAAQEVMDEAKDLALVLRAGALPAPVEILETRAVGPSLGRDSIEHGLKAILIGVFIIVIFMAFYYRISGIVADMAVLINLIFILGCLGALHATLTLPGIAGILISIGMAVDANVIIFERVREELRAGRPIKAAVELGYERAHLTILDSNLTTVITALVLLQYGTGPIKGFALTLIFGLIANYVTAVWFTRLGYDWVIARIKPERLSI